MLTHKRRASGGTGLVRAVRVRPRTTSHSVGRPQRRHTRLPYISSYTFIQYKLCNLALSKYSVKTHGLHYHLRTSPRFEPDALLERQTATQPGTQAVRSQRGDHAVKTWAQVETIAIQSIQSSSGPTIKTLTRGPAGRIREFVPIKAQLLNFQSNHPTSNHFEFFSLIFIHKYLSV